MKLLSIQALRGIAVLLVFAYHAAAREAALVAKAGGAEAPLLGGLWTNGYAGVDLFFVISGFIMVFITGRAGASSAGAFLFARAARIYPLWWLFSTVAVIYLLAAYGAPYNVDSVAGTALVEDAPWRRLAASYALLPQAPMPIISVGWTLVHEMYFYLVFALILLAPRRLTPVLLAAWGGLVVLGSLAGWSSHHARGLVELAVHPMTLEFILGAFVAMLVINGRRWRPALVAGIGAAALLAALAFAPAPDAQMLLWGRVAWFGLPCAAIVYGVAGLDVEGRFQTPRVLSDLGDWSYAFYLSHILTLLALERLLSMVAERASEAGGEAGEALARFASVGAPGPVDNVVFLVAALVLSTLVAWGAYSLFERPIDRLARRARATLFQRSAGTLRPSAIRATIW